jgi:hypothetical protein
LRLTEEAELGIYRAPRGSSDFEQRYVGSVGCLTWTAEGIYACTLEAHTGFSLGLIRNTDFELGRPAELEPLLRLGDVVGAIECEACSTGAICRDYWYAACQGWGRADCLELRADECSAGAGGTSSAGAPATDGFGGAGGGAPDAGGTAGQVSAGARGEELRARGGCACRSMGGGSSAGAGIACILLLVRARRRRRR